MPTRDFRAALAQFCIRFNEMADQDESLREAAIAVRQVVDKEGVLLTDVMESTLVALAAAVAVNTQDYAHDALRLTSQGPADNVWRYLAQPVRDLLTEVWPDEGGLMLAAKIGVAVISEGFVYH